MKCSKCSQENRPGAKFCEKCGETIDLSPGLACSKCGLVNPQSSKFCKGCGSTLNSKIGIDTLKKSSSDDRGPTSTANPKSTLKSNVDTSEARLGGSAKPHFEAKQSSKSSAVKLGKIGLGVLLLLIVGKFFFGGSDEKPTRSDSISKPAAAGYQPIANETKDGGGAPQTNAINNDQPPFFIQAQKYVLQMVKASQTRDQQSIDQSILEIERLDKPQRGNRKLARQLNESGLTAIKLQNYSLAVSELNEALNYDQSDPEILNNLGYAYYETGDLPRARGCIEVAIALSPKRSSAWTNYGVILFKQGFKEQAVYAYLLAFKFSKNPDGLLRYVEKQSVEDSDSQLRAFYASVLDAINKK